MAWLAVFRTMPRFFASESGKVVAVMNTAA